MMDDSLRLMVMREFLETIARDPWIEGRIKVAAKDALRHWDDPLYHGREHERSVAFQEAGAADTGGDVPA